MENAQEGYRIELPDFEGPLDLLLHLVKKHELSIVDIPISFITGEYLKMLDLMESLHLDTAGEYLLMAATLCHLKSRELVPPDPSELASDADAEAALEDGIDPRQELIRRLLEYQKYKEAADQLGKRPVVGRNVWSRGAPAEDAVSEGVNAEAIAPLAPFPVHKLIEAFDRVMQLAKVKVAHNVLIDRLSVSQKIAELTDRLEAEGGFTFTSMFTFLRDGIARSLDDIRHEAVVTFLALLEMAKLRLIRLSQHEARGEAAAANGGATSEEEIYIQSATDDLRARVEQGIARDDYR